MGRKAQANDLRDDALADPDAAPPDGQKLASIKLLGLGVFKLSHAPAGENDEEHHMLASARLYCQQMELEPGS